MKRISPASSSRLAWRAFSVAEQHRRVPVVAARVHDAGVLGRELETGSPPGSAARRCRRAARASARAGRFAGARRRSSRVGRSSSMPSRPPSQLEEERGRLVLLRSDSSGCACRCAAARRSPAARARARQGSSRRHSLLVRTTAGIFRRLSAKTCFTDETRSRKEDAWPSLPSNSPRTSHKRLRRCSSARSSRSGA